MDTHRTVLLQEAVDALISDPDGCYVDGTFGRGGHSRLMLQRLGAGGRLLVIDKDPEAVAVAEEMRATDARVYVRQGSFADLGHFLEEVGNIELMGVLFDLGVSSPQLDDAGRGFSFSQDGPLDMRMNPQQGISAAQWLNDAAEGEIARVIYEYGEERYSRRMARAIVEQRQQQSLTSTLQLAEIIKQANPSWEKHKHPATRAFQAIRIFINNELDELESGLAEALRVLSVGGRLVVISFHSLEDRLVKRFMQKQSKGDNFPPGVPVRQVDLNPTLKIIGKPYKADVDEVRENIRARSAIMRVAEKTAEV